MTRRLLAGLIGLAVGGALVAGCGSGGNTASSTTAAAGAATASSKFNDADVTFAQSMIPHHEQAVEMADIALDPKLKASASVKDLATRIKAAQGPEIATMTTWLKGWGKPTTMDSAGHNMSAMDGMMNAADMKALGAATGPSFDTAFYEMMIRHHEGAITMANKVQKDGVNPDVKALAGLVISAQTAEISEMKKALGK